MSQSGADSAPITQSGLPRPPSLVALFAASVAQRDHDSNVNHPGLAPGER